MIFLPNAPVLLPLFDYKVLRTLNGLRLVEKKDKVDKLKECYDEIRSKIKNAESLNENDRLMISLLN